jgi:hypothetical protein
MERGISIPADYSKARSDCGVLAVAIATGVSYAKAWDALRFIAKQGFLRGRPCRRFTGGTNTSERQFIMARFGLEFYVHYSERRQTLQTLVTTRLDSRKRFMVRTTKHVQMVKDGHVTDQRGTVPIRLYWGRKKFVTEVIEIAD